MKQIISKIMSFISPDKTSSMSSAPLANTKTPPDSKTISDHILELKNLSVTISERSNHYGMDFTAGREDEYTASASFKFSSVPGDKFFEINDFLKSRCIHLLTREEWYHDIVSSYVLHADRNMFCLMIGRTRYSSLGKYFEVVIEACRFFGMHCEQSVQMVISDLKTFNSVPATGILHLDEGYYEIVSFDYLVSLHLNKG